MDKEFSIYNNSEEAVLTPELLRVIFDTIPTGIELLEAIRDENNKIIDFEYILENETVRKCPGYMKRVGKKFLSENGTDHELFKKMKEVVESGKPSHGTFSSEIDGDTQWFDARYVKSGNAIIVYRENITKKKLSEQSIRNNAHFINQIVETSPEIIYIMDLNTLQTIYTNRQIAVDLGYTKKQIALMKNPLMDIMWEEDIPAFKEHLEKIKTLTSDGNVLEIEYRLKDGKGNITWICDRNTVFKRNNRGIPVEKLGFSQNITLRKTQEQQLLTDKDILIQAEQMTGMGSWEYDILTGDYKWSEGMYKLFNLPKKIKPTPHIYYNYTSEKEQPVVDRIVNCITRDFIAFEETISLLSHQKENRIIKIKAMAILDKTKKPVKMVGVDLDITSQVKSNKKIKLLNETLVSKNRDLQELNRELKTFNQVASNDYKETLSILYTNLEYIATTDARRLSDGSKANIRRAQSAIQRMKLLTDDINNYLRLYDIAVSKSLIDPNAILKTVAESMERKIMEKNASVESVVLPPIYADPVLVFHLFRHLINNAINFRRVTVLPLVKIKYSRADEINNIPGSKQDTPYVIISVSDNGLGFHEEHSERLFEVFFRNEATKNDGSGIGLAVCKKIMSMHGGFIIAEGVPGVGATFSCYFPDEEIGEQGD